MEAQHKGSNVGQAATQDLSNEQMFTAERSSAWRALGRPLALAAALAPAASVFVEPIQPAPAATVQTEALRGVERIATSAEAEKWLAEQLELATNSLSGEGRKLVDGSIFYSAANERAIAGYVGQRDAQSGFEFKRVSDDGYKFAFVKADGETWYLTESAYYPDQYPSGMSFSESSFVLWKKGTEKLTQKEFHATDLFTLGSTKRVKFDGFKSITNAAEENRKSEERDSAGVRQFKLGRETVGYVGMVDPSVSDPIMIAMQDDTRYFAQFMNSLRDETGAPRYNYVAHNGSEYVAVRSTPRDILRAHVQAMHAEGIRSFHVLLNGHGNDQGIYFGSRRLSPSDLTGIFTEFKDSKFVVDSIACYGGGVADAMRAYRDPSGETGRVFVKLQAKPFSYNQEGRIDGEAGRNGAPKAYSSYYNIFHTYFLKKGMELGEAHWQADRAAKRFISCDAEAWVTGPNGSSGTMALE